MRVGCDIVAISRIEKIYNRHGTAFLDRFLHPAEQKFSQSIPTLAGLWAAKEAASKALGLGISQECTFFDIRIAKNQRNAPQLEFSPHLIQKFAIHSASLSISHDGGFAIAVVVLV
ncbi:holo-ACP synthase [Campylobacter sp. MIT 21-1685]|uniref:holo-ACP synthase n=1 Tax=unclassified Campylobacter TaxID=2593542 RepID=UPI00224BA106|nr:MULTISPECIES: holo-ACP synthase [unclassified Campylobacter]MCX2683284.1 holo-ACP synthase [Campylobacter sp. MIT 21-1684]MCX2751523.1 holo-ACP synthase [Campylobacter sp. MIT 21-1682]MCX2807722.1 holo-ACP synthase [Campylobacter sp. MIT 21-1685]